MMDSTAFLALDGETTNFRSLVRSGTQLLRAYRSENDLAGILTCYALGAEKLLKLSIGLRTVADGKPWPPKRQMQEMGHDVVSLDETTSNMLSANIGRAPAPGHVEAMRQKVVANPLVKPLLTVLGDYGRFGRFHDLDQLAGSPQAIISPRYQWQDITKMVPMPESTFEDLRGPNPWVEDIKVAVEDAMLDWCHQYTNAWAQGVFGPTAKQHAQEVSVSALQLGSGDDI